MDDGSNGHASARVRTRGRSVWAGGRDREGARTVGGVGEGGWCWAMAAGNGSGGGQGQEQGRGQGAGQCWWVAGTGRGHVPWVVWVREAGVE